METSAAGERKASGLGTVLNTIAAPKDAFATLREAPTWGWAFIIAFVLMAIAVFLEAPANAHMGVAITQHMMATSSLFANMTPEQKQQALARAAHPNQIFGVVGVGITIFVIALLNAVMLLIANAVGRGTGTFKQLWAASMNIAVPTLGIGAIVLGVITIVRGPDAFNGAIDMARAVPGLGWVVPGTSAMAAFFAQINVFTLWGFFLNALALTIIARVSKGVAYGFAAAILILGALVASSVQSALHF